MTTTPSIWPGPECLDTDSERAARRIDYLMARDGLSWERARRIVHEADIGRRSTAERRTLGIALGRAKARARMERFVAWLRGMNACERGLSVARRSLSPESAVLLAARENYSHVRWLAASPVFPDRIWRLVRDAFDERKEAAAVNALLRSNAWVFLPWQQEPSEVSRG